MEPKFTKGKWSKNETLFTGLHMTSVNHPDEAEAEANTAMALAAPDMYAALEKSVTSCISCGGSGVVRKPHGFFMVNRPCESCSDARSALSRARGETK